MDKSAAWDPFAEALIEPFAYLYIAGLYQNLMPSLLEDLDGSWLEAGREIHWDRVYETTGEETTEAFWRTLLVDHDQYAQDALNRRIPLTTDVTALFDHCAHRKVVWMGFRQQVVYDYKETPRLTRLWREKLQSSMLHKRFFVTEKGFMGVAPANFRVGDIVCVLFGGRVPFGLRPVAWTDCFELVEEIYLHGFMDGRAVDMAHKGDFEEK